MAWKKASNKFVRQAFGKRKIRRGRAFSFTGTIKPKLSGSGRSSTKKLYKTLETWGGRFNCWWCLYPGCEESYFPGKLQHC